MPRVFIRTFGCQMNEYDSARMVDVLREAGGYEPTDDPAQADLLLLNTCSVREKAQEKVFSQLGGWRQLKKNNPGLLIGVGGCVASQEGDGITKRAPYVDLVFGPQTLHRLPDMINEIRAGGRSVVDVSFPEIEKFDHLPAPRAEGATAFVSIMEGCSKYCTFCVVPYTRGEEVSRPFESVMTEIRQLADQGVKEINLLGQNVNAYNGPMDDGTPCDLGTLIYCVADVPGIERIRFTTSHPVEFKDSLIEAYRDVPQLANYLHLPVQSGSDRILMAMKRGYTALEYKQKIRKLRAVRPDIMHLLGLHHRLPRRDRERFRSDHEPDRRRRLRSVLQLHLQPSPRYAGGVAAGRCHSGREAQATGDSAGAHQSAARGDQSSHGRHGATCAGRAAREETCRDRLPARPRTCAGSTSMARTR